MGNKNKTQSENSHTHGTSSRFHSQNEPKLTLDGALSDRQGDDLPIGVMEGEGAVCEAAVKLAMVRVGDEDLVKTVHALSDQHRTRGRDNASGLSRELAAVTEVDKRGHAKHVAIG